MVETTKKNDPQLFQEYIDHGNQLELELYQTLADLSAHVGFTGSKGMAILAMTAAIDLYRKCGIEDKEIYDNVASSMQSLDNLMKQSQ